MISVAGFADSEYQHLLQAAKNKKNIALAEKLEAMQPRINPESPWQSFIQHEDFILAELDRLGKGMSPLGDDISTLFAVREQSRYLSYLISWRDLWHTRFGRKALSSVDNTFSNAFMSVNLPDEIGNKFEVPIILFAGANDWHVPINYQRNWYEKVIAPYKKMVVFNQSRHYPYLEEPGEYLLALVNEVLPLKERNTMASQYRTSNK